jgi:hypothetical protein
MRQIVLNTQNWIIYFTAFKGTLLQKQFMSVQLDPEPQGIIDYFALAWQKILSAYSDNTILITCGMAFAFEYLVQVYL